MSLTAYSDMIPSPTSVARKKKPIPMLDVVKWSTKLERFLAYVECIVCKNLAAEVILQANFCNRFVETIRLRKMLVKFDDGWTVPIVRRAIKQSSTSSSLPHEQKSSRTEKPLTTAFKASKVTIIPPTFSEFTQVSYRTKRSFDIST